MNTLWLLIGLVAGAGAVLLAVRPRLRSLSGDAGSASVRSVPAGAAPWMRSVLNIEARTNCRPPHPGQSLSLSEPESVST